MKKIFQLNSPKAKPQRQLDSVRHEIKKYFARERRKKLPEGFEVWNFDCKFGNTAKDAAVLLESEIKESINKFISEKKISFYIEIIARAANKPEKKAKTK